MRLNSDDVGFRMARLLWHVGRLDTASRAASTVVLPRRVTQELTQHGQMLRAAGAQHVLFFSVDRWTEVSDTPAVDGTGSLPTEGLSRRTQRVRTSFWMSPTSDCGRVDTKV